ncbi:MAG: molybdate ABC transporter substrate-binding protein [Anaerolinea sp.]|nr:molybdate ABC transporter substrate-binding protein [Anaerolinea sp.]
MAAVLAACGAGDRGTPELRVYAAASLTDAFTEVAKQFEAAHPGVGVALNFGSSSTLAAQINEGAPADVFAPASAAQLAELAAGGRVESGRIFATNSLVVAAAKESPVESFRDLARPGVRLVLAGKDVPAGEYAREALRKASTPEGYGTSFAASVLANLKSEEVNVRAALTKVELGEADAAVVYVTDLGAARGVRSVAIPAEFNVVAEYPVALVHGANGRQLAEAFVAYLLSPEGQAILARHGFGPPQ